MRSEDLLWAMGDIDEQLIAEADPCAAVSKEGSGDGHKKNETEEELTRQQSGPAGERRDTEKVISPFRAKWMTARMISAAAAVIFTLLAIRFAVPVRKEASSMGAVAETAQSDAADAMTETARSDAAGAVMEIAQNETAGYAASKEEREAAVSHAAVLEAPERAEDLAGEQAEEAYYAGEQEAAEYDREQETAEDRADRMEAEDASEREEADYAEAAGEANYAAEQAAPEEYFSLAGETAGSAAPTGAAVAGAALTDAVPAGGVKPSSDAAAAGEVPAGAEAKAPAYTKADQLKHVDAADTEAAGEASREKAAMEAEKDRSFPLWPVFAVLAGVSAAACLLMQKMLQ